MKIRLLLPLAGLWLAGTAYGQTDSIPYANTIAITPSDTHETIMAKASHVVPTPNQLNALQNEFIAFIHFGPNTFTRREWGTGKEEPKVFDLKTLDTDQWCEAMQAAGMKMVLLTVKHHDGFVIWQSRYTRHGIMSTTFRDGKGDVLKDLSASCRKYGLKLGIYLSPADLYQIENPQGLYGNGSKYSLRTIPREVPGRPFNNPTRFQFVVDDYNEYFLNQLFELLTEYGPIHEVWFDGAHPKRKGGQTYQYKAWRELIHKLAPEAVIFGREDVRWCGNEAGGTRGTEWNVVPYAFNPDTASVFPDITATDIGSREKLYTARYLHYQQAETNTSIREGWFYRDDERQQVRSADDVFDMYERSVGGNSTFLLNIPPNREGRFSPADVSTLRETGKRIRETYGTDLLHGAQGPRELLDGTTATYLETADAIVIRTTTPITFNRLVLQEAVAQRSERVEGHAVDIHTPEGWKEITRSTNIGYKRILRFPDVTTDGIRIRITAARALPAIANITAHRYQTRPPQLVCRRNTDGTVSLEARKQDFGWKAHGEDIAANLSAGYRIHYTTDGTEPDASSPLYTAPFAMQRGELKAVAVLNGEKGAVLHERIGLPKAGWKVLGCDSETAKHEAALAIDGNASTWWASGETGTHFIAIDLGRKETLNGFAYTPQTAHGQGMVAKGRILTSTDGRKWKVKETFEFGNLVNDPTRRFHYFKKPLKAQYVRIEVTETAAGSPTACIAELDWF